MGMRMGRGYLALEVEYCYDRRHLFLPLFSLSVLAAASVLLSLVVVESRLNAREYEYETKPWLPPFEI